VLRDGSRGSTGRGVGLVTRGLVVLQVVVTCVLLVGSLLWVRSILNQQRIDYGYDTRAVLTARIGLMEAAHASPESRKLFYDRLLTSLRASPDFRAAALTSRNRMVYSGTTRIEIDGKAYKRKGDRPLANWEKVSSEYAEAIGQKVVQGRAIAEEDRDNKLPVAVVNEAFVQRHFGRADAVGRRFRTVTDDEQFGPWRTIVGVVATVRMVGPMSKAAVGDVGFYVPFYGTVDGPALPAPLPSQFATVIVRPRTTVPAERLAAALRREVDKVDRDLPLYFVGTPAQHIDNAMAQNGVIAGMFVLFGIVAVVMASVGIYAMMSFSVNQRRQEFGVRMALGADSRRMLRVILRQGALQLVIGLTLGFGLTLLLASVGRDVLADMLFGVSPRDPFTYTAVLGVVAVVSLIAILIPGWRATRVDPMIALRTD
jgi:predicted permease